MNILLFGGSGMIGRALQHRWRQRGWRVNALRRNESTDAYLWQPEAGVLNVRNIADYQVVVNLCGDNVGEGRWNKAKKGRILHSRIDSTKTIAQFLADQAAGPGVMINASGIGFYGDTGEDIVDESAAKGHGFMADVASSWEQAQAPARAADIRCVNLRLGMVLDAKDGALAKMVTPFRLGLGGRIGSGRQLLSWIALYDVCRAIDFIIENETIRGPCNLSSPDVVSNAYFSDCLAASLGRKALLPMPASMARLAFGEMADELLLASCGAEPTKLLQAGFEFDYPMLERALQQLFARP